MDIEAVAIGTSESSVFVYCLLFFDEALEIRTGGVKKTSDSQIRWSVWGFIVVARDRSVPAVLSGKTKVFHESISKTALSFPDVKFVALGTGDRIHEVS